MTVHIWDMHDYIRFSAYRVIFIKKEVRYTDTLTLYIQTTLKPSAYYILTQILFK